MELKEKLLKTIGTIGSNYVIDPEVKRIGGQEINHWNTTLLALSYLLNQNALLTGEPGFSKTTVAKVVSSVMSGYPLDLYESAQIQGHPDQTYETMIARLDFSKLNVQESVIWLSSAYLPLRIVDELQRLPEGKQEELLNVLETGRFNYLNATFFTGKAPFFATVNYPDDGSSELKLIYSLRDRFAITLELGYIGATYDGDIEEAVKRIDSDLKHKPTTDLILEVVNDRDSTIAQRLQKMDYQRQDYRASLEQKLGFNSVFTSVEKERIQLEIEAIPLSTEARVFLEMISSELNSTPTYKRKRSSDQVDGSNWAKKLASSKTKNGLSPRTSLRGFKSYSKALAYLSGEKSVSKFHLDALAPHVLGHKLRFTEDYKAEYRETQREGKYGFPLEMFLASKLVGQIEENYAAVKTDLDLVVHAHRDPNSLLSEHRERLEDLEMRRDEVGHPLILEYLDRIRSMK